jgi:hypothetical protein
VWAVALSEVFLDEAEISIQRKAIEFEARVVALGLPASCPEKECGAWAPTVTFLQASGLSLAVHMSQAFSAVDTV